MNKLLISFVGGFVVACLLTCPSGKATYTPQKSGSFDTTTPMHSVVYVHDGKPVRPTDPNGDKEPQPDYTGLFNRYEVQLDSAANAYADLDAAFQRANDSLQKELYKRAIQPSTFSQSKDDDNVHIDVTGVVMGQITTMGIDYTVKPQKCHEHDKKRLFYGGAGLLGGAPTLNAALNIGRFQVNGLTGQGVWGVGVLYGF